MQLKLQSQNGVINNNKKLKYKKKKQIPLILSCLLGELWAKISISYHTVSERVSLMSV